MSSDESLLRSSTTMAIGTVVSRVTGLIRGLLTVALLGTALLGDVFNVANTMPNILYNLIVGGALTAVFVPQLVRAMRDSDGGSAFVSRLVTATTVILGALTVLSIFAAPLFVRIFASSYVGRPEFQLTTLIMRYCLPQVFFIGLYALLSQITNAKGKFGPMMWAPVANNLVGIAVIGYFLARAPHWSVATISHREATWLGVGTTLGYVIQFAVLVPVVIKTRVKIHIRFDWRDPELRKSWHLASWTIIFAAISQLGYLITVNLSSSAAVHAEKLGITTGVGFTPYSNAYFIMLLPHSVITISLVTALLPHLSDLAIDKKFDAVHDQLVRAIRLVGIFTVPSACALILFGTLITRTLFFGISNADAQYIGFVLAGFALGLMPMSINLIALRGLNAFENVKLQVLSNFVMNLLGGVIAVLVAITLNPRWVTVGLAGALSLSYFIGAWTTLRLLHRYNVRIRVGEVAGLYLRLAGIFLFIAIPLRLALRFIPGGNTVHLLVVLVVAGLGYLGAARIFKIDEVGSAFNLLLRRA
jgi:putative peptidoglycan lipid II flippase